LANGKIMKTNRQNLGRKGEDLAARYLSQQGYKILHRNYRIGKAEIDIIALDNDDLVIVEVKSVRTTFFGSGVENITRRKKTMLILAAYAFLELYPAVETKNLRFDVIAIDFTCHPAVIRHYQAAFWQQTDNLQ
jgi:putative endonuclease